MNFKKAFYILLIIIGILICLNLRQCSTVNNLLNQVDTFSVRHDKDGKLIATQKQNILSEKDALKLGLLEKDKYWKSIVSQTKAGIEIILKDKPVPYAVEVQKIVYVDSSTKDTFVCIRVPLPVKYFNKDSSTYLVAEVRADSFYIDSMGMITDLMVTIGNQKRGFFKSPNPVVEIKLSNKDAKINTMTNIQIKKRTPFYRSWVSGLIVGITTVLLIFK